MESVVNFLGASIEYDLADRICCNNHVFAEPSGYLEQPEIMFFDRLDPTVETVFYDSVCGIPLFIAPRGRTFDDFAAESIYHGWPSFRPEEIVSENVKIYNGGRMESKCGTHLGHNLPDGGVDRYCIDLVCMAGMAMSSDELVSNDSVILASDFDASSYTSSAEQWSGKNPSWTRRVIISSCLGVLLFLVAVYFLYSTLRSKRANTNSKSLLVEDNSTAKQAGGQIDLEKTGGIS